jgi:predicted PurR-regulated permease PerM
MTSASPFSADREPPTAKDAFSVPTVAEQKSLRLWTIWMTALCVILLWAAYLVRDVLLLIYISGLLAVGFSPIVRLIERQRFLPIGTQRFPRWLAILILYLFILGVLTGIGFLIVPPLVHQAQQLWSALPDMFDKAQTFLVEKGLLRQRMTMTEVVASTPMSHGGEAVTTVFGALVGVVGGIFGTVTILILTFYLLVEAQQLRATLLRLFPVERRKRADAASRDITIKVSAWLGGQLLLGAMVGGSSALGLWLLGVPFFYVLALISGIGELIPIVGPVLSAIPALAVASSISLKTVLFVLIFFIVQQQFENHVLVPKVMARQVGVSAVTVIVSLLIGVKLLGILGAILAVPTAAILQVLYSELNADRKD